MEKLGEIMKDLKKPTLLHPTTQTYNCDLCRDNGMIYALKEGNVNYSEVIPCPDCVTDEKMRKLLNVSSMEATFDNFKVVKGTEKAYKAARQLAFLKSDWKLLLIYGTWGNGKTHLCESTAIYLWKRFYIICPVMSMPEMMVRIKSSFDRRNIEGVYNTYNVIINGYCTRPHLIIDDIAGCDSGTDFAWSQLESIILSRYRGNLFTMMTTNQDINNFPEFIRSRLSDSIKSRMILNSGVDYRPLKNDRIQRKENDG